MHAAAALCQNGTGAGAAEAAARLRAFLERLASPEEAAKEPGLLRQEATRRKRLADSLAVRCAGIFRGPGEGSEVVVPDRSHQPQAPRNSLPT